MYVVSRAFDAASTPMPHQHHCMPYQHLSMPHQHHLQQISKKIGDVKTNPYQRNGSRMARGVIMASYYKNFLLTFQVVMVK